VARDQVKLRLTRWIQVNLAWDLIWLAFLPVSAFFFIDVDDIDDMALTLNLLEWALLLPITLAKLLMLCLRDTT